MRKIILLILSINFMFATTNSISIQGVLRDNYNRAVDDGIYNMSFIIYSAESGGSVLWSSLANNNNSDYEVQVINGVYSYALPVHTDIQSGSSQLWLEVTVNNSTMTNRVKINLTPYEYYNVTGGTNQVPESGNVYFGANVEVSGTLEASTTNFNNSISASDIATDAVGSDEIAANAVGQSELGSNAVTTAHLADDAVTTSDIAWGAVGSSDIATDAVDSRTIATDAVDSEHYADGSIDNAHIADNAINSEHYANDSIDKGHMAPNVLWVSGLPEVICEGAYCHLYTMGLESNTYGEINGRSCGENGGMIHINKHNWATHGDMEMDLDCDGIGSGDGWFRVAFKESYVVGNYDTMTQPCPSGCRYRVRIEGYYDSYMTFIHQYHFAGE